ncbi:hypothetical protein BDN72DRAFT_831160 [Pluteus cervinus]|uniref:Uncharacterized protein n=1 Tax=Pluteus cervinus TaxID=181527 RepID=A0ACD3BEV9_9AGAR|nr:hypothetical protein BDN72DRAFT_831160 [Pluteus cervinus]
MPPNVKRTYGSRHERTTLPSSSPPSSPPLKRKRSFLEPISLQNLPPRPLVKRTKLSPSEGRTKKAKQPQKKLTQLHFCLDKTMLRTCPLCELSYMKGAPDDETLHQTHCARVRKGMEWGKEEEKEAVKANVREVAVGVRLKDGKQGRIICFNADVGGKIGSKLFALLETINRSLSSPAMTAEALQASKAYLFLLPPSTTSGREKIVGCVMAQQITTAMAIASPNEVKANRSDGSPATSELVAVDATTGLFCLPTPLPTPLGIPRIFVSSSHRRQRIASELLTAAAATFIHGCKLNPREGQVAFTQPTGDGNAVMRHWGLGGIRIYEG